MDHAKGKTPLRVSTGTLLDGIRKRKEQHKELSLKQSERVTKKYILRMTRRMSNKTSRVNSTADHRLSEVLKRKILDMKTQKELMKKNLLGVQRKKEDQERERNSLREQIMTKLSLLQVMRSLLRSEDPETSVTEYSEALKRGRESNSQLSIEMLKEIIKKKESEDKGILIVHWSSQLSMKNVVLGDCLKALFHSFHSLSTGGKALAIVRDLKQQGLQVTSCKEGFISETHSLCKDSRSLSLNSLTLLGEYEGLYKNLSSKKHSIGRKLLKLKRELLEACAIEETQKELYKAQSHSYSNLETTFNSAKALLASRGNHHHELKITCRNCLGEYHEGENTQNPCKVHPGGWNGQMFWCCASTSQRAPPCLRTKHLPINFSSKEEATKQQCFSSEKDPNVRTGFDGEVELERILNMRFAYHRKTVPPAVPASESALKSSSIKPPRK